MTGEKHTCLLCENICVFVFEICIHFSLMKNSWSEPWLREDEILVNDDPF